MTLTLDIFSHPRTSFTARAKFQSRSAGFPPPTTASEVAAYDSLLNNTATQLGWGLQCCNQELSHWTTGPQTYRYPPSLGGLLR